MRARVCLAIAWVTCLGGCGRFGFGSEGEGAADAARADGGAFDALSVDGAVMANDVGGLDASGLDASSEADAGMEDSDSGCSCATGTVCVGEACVSQAPPTLAAGGGTSCSLRAPGELYCWGDGRMGELGTGIAEVRGTAARALVGATYTVTGVSGGGGMCVLSSAGEMRCDGSLRGVRLNPTVVLAGPMGGGPSGEILHFAMGAWHGCGVRRDGGVRCFGFNDGGGQLGDGTTTNSFAAAVTVVGLTDAVRVAAGYQHTCALRRDGTVSCWGHNDYFQLGNTAGRSAVPVAIAGLGDVVGLGAGGYTTCIVRANGRVACFGSNDYGQLGDGTPGTNRATPVDVPGVSDVTQVAVGGASTCALQRDGAVYCWGANSYGQTGRAASGRELVPAAVPGITGIVEIAGSGSHMCAKRADQRVFCWGANTVGQAGNGTVPRRLSPVEVPGIDNAVEVASGLAHTCVVLSNHEARCWGDNSDGQLGDGTGNGRVSPVTVMGVDDAVDVAVGNRHSCFVKTSGEVACIGRNVEGQCGYDPSMPKPPLGTPIAGLDDVVAVGAGTSFTCAARADGRVLCWGSNSSDRLGRVAGDLTPPYRPGVVDLPGVDLFSHVSAGDQHACAVRASDGQVYCWGTNGYRQLGDGTSTPRPMPVQASGVVGMTEVSCSPLYCCAMGPSGVDCWGHNGYGQIGNGMTAQTFVAVPYSVPIVGTPSAVGVGQASTCAIVPSGLVCFGDNSLGELGDGTTQRRTSPVTTPLSAVQDLGMGASHGCVVVGGRVHCWGWNASGQLGLGEVAYAAPIEVALP